MLRFQDSIHRYLPGIGSLVSTGFALDTEGVNPEELTVMKPELVKGMDPYHESIFEDEDTPQGFRLIH